MNDIFDIIVVGAGHAGSEAAAAAAKMGSKVLLITMDLTKIAQMSCNPAMGGIAKGQIIREIDALGGLSGYITDKTMIQFRMLNMSKGPAMWSPRAQSDRVKFSIEWRKSLESISNLFFWQDTVKSLLIENNIVKGVKTFWGVNFYSKAVIITAGTFLNGLMHIGYNTNEGGRINEPSAIGLSNQISDLKIPTHRMKTGTPVRIDGRSVDFSKLEPQYGDNPPGKFSFDPDSKMVLPSRECYMVYTSPQVHNELKKGFKFSPLFTGIIKGVGPRYCPSIEDKLVTFSDKDRHLLFLEPEGTDTNEFYLNGFSSSLPIETQYNALKLIPGFENVSIFKPGYAIEYDYFDPTFLYHTLESKVISNLFFAGQVNGTTGYEEAAAQGLIAGINAHNKIKNKKQLVLARDNSYIGVLIDDLVTKGVDEPYRMFTSRAEYRILLRQDNADFRLSKIGHEIELLSDYRYNLYKNKYKLIENIFILLKQKSLSPTQINSILEKNNSPQIKQAIKADKLLLRPEINIYSFLSLIPEIYSIIDRTNLEFDDILKTTEFTIKYSSYYEREKLIAEKTTRLENVKIPQNIDYYQFRSLSTEAKQKLSKIKPNDIGQASRIPGVSPSDINVLLIFLGR